MSDEKPRAKHTDAERQVRQLGIYEAAREHVRKMRAEEAANPGLAERRIADRLQGRADLGWGPEKPDVDDYVAEFRFVTNTPSGSDPWELGYVAGQLPHLVHEWSEGMRTTVGTLHDLADYPEITATWKVDMLDPKVDIEGVLHLREVVSVNSEFASAVLTAIEEYQATHEGNEPPLVIRKKIEKNAFAVAPSQPKMF